MEASVARCLRTPPDVATRQGLKSAFQTALRGLSHRSIVVVGNYCYGPITAEPYRAKARPLRPRRSYFAPITCPPCAGIVAPEQVACLSYGPLPLERFQWADGGGAGYCPRVR